MLGDHRKPVSVRKVRSLGKKDQSINARSERAHFVKRATTTHGLIIILVTAKSSREKKVYTWK